MNLWQRLLNTPPAPGMSFVTDSQGRKYWMNWDEDEGSSFLHLYHHGRLVGRVNLLWEPSQLELADIVILDPKLRWRGVGSALMKHVIALAHQRGALAIHGSVTSEDIKNTPGLLEWYQHHGFQVRPTSSGRFVARISLDLAQG